MEDLKVTGKITVISEVKEGVTKKDASPYKAMSFVIDNGEEFNNLIAFSMYQGKDKENIDNFIKFNKIGQEVDVKFNIRTSLYKEKYYTDLSAWSIFAGSKVEDEVEDEIEVPF